MRGLAIRLGAAIVVLGVVTQLAIPPYLEHRLANRLTAHGGHAQVQLGAFPAVRLLFGHGKRLHIHANHLSLDLSQNQPDVFDKLEDFQDVDVIIGSSRAGPLTIRSFVLRRLAAHRYDVLLSATGTAGDVARYAGERLAGGFGQALAGLAAGAIGAFPVDARMQIDTSVKPPRADDVVGDVAGLPAGPLAGIVANTLLGALWPG